MALSSIFFDFDGVLAESVSAKTEAFRELYRPYGKEVADKVVDYHLAHGGVSRFEKFKYWEHQLLSKKTNQAQLDTLANKFSELVLQKVIDADEVPGSKDFLHKYHKSIDFWIITGTPTVEIREILKKRNLAPYFKEAFGSPENKKHWTEYLIATYHLQRNNTLFLGDATTDLEAALCSGIHFALRENDENRATFETYSGLRFRDFYELEALLQKQKLI
ncbi:MAG: HAD hydrolase-like protein [Eudoraea sp.]|nr:HAD hydrolase-like protein [Eudoraea sp.]MBT8320953.1 HAD hydrolase-like protein [Eudoraea sp.]